MAASSFRARSNRRNRSYKRGHSAEIEEIQLDNSKDVYENLKFILPPIIKPDNASHKEKLSYLNAFVKLCQQNGNIQVEKFPNRDIICCLRVALVNEEKKVRTAGIRALRYFLQDTDKVDEFLGLHCDKLLCRSLDIVLDNEMERIQALKLVRKMLNVSPDKMSLAVMRCIVSLANDEPAAEEKLIRSCLCIISELAIVNPALCAECGGLNTIINKAMDIHQAWMNEAMMGVVLYLINDSKTRPYIRKFIHIEKIIAQITDLHYQHTIESNDSNKAEERQLRQQASKQALKSAFRSWPGLVWLSRPQKDSGLNSLIDGLYLEYDEVQNCIMEMLFDLFRIPLPKFTSDITTAILSIDPATPKDSWELHEGFVAEEAKDILPNLTKYRVNIVDNYLALLLFAFVNGGVLNALVQVIAKSSNKHITIRATILLAELLNLTSFLLPPECSQHCQALPYLLTMATSFDVPKHHRHQASVAVSNLTMIHKLKKRGVVPSSLFLDQLIRFCSASSSHNRRKSVGDLVSRSKLESCFKSSDELLNAAIKDSCVLLHTNHINWDWNLIASCIFKWSTDNFKRLEDVNHRTFVRCIVNFFKPSNRLFCSLPINQENSMQYSFAALHLIEFLLDADEGEGGKIHDEWMRDIAKHLSEVAHNNISSESIFSPHKLSRTLAQHYFLFFGKLSSSTKGCKVLERSGIFQILLEMIDVNCNSCFIKLMCSSLDYTKPIFSRILLNKILTSSSEEARLYGTKMLLVLLRCKISDFHKWVVELLVSLIYDKDRQVSSLALSILDEACNNTVNLEALIQLRPTFLHLGDNGLLLLIRFLSVPSGFKFLKDANFIIHEISKWETTFVYKYVDIVEAELNQVLTLHQVNNNGVYGRHDSEKHTLGDLFIPMHLYGQLALHEEGFTMLISHAEALDHHINAVQFADVSDHKAIHKLKAALWALGHVGTSNFGIAYLNNRRVIPDIVKLAEECPVFSVRGTSYYVMGLLASTTIGANLLGQVGWQTKRHHRLEKWPVIKMNNFEDDLAEEYRRHYSSSSCESRSDESVLASGELNFYNKRTKSTSEQTIQTQTSRTRSSSSTCQFTNSSQWMMNSGGSFDENSDNVSQERTFRSSMFAPDYCNVLHIRHSSVSANLDHSSDVNNVTKERSRSLTESKTENKSRVIIKVDSDTRLQQLAKPSPDGACDSWLDEVDSSSAAIDENEPTKNRCDSYADSTTSGISSCESVTAKTARQLSSASNGSTTLLSPDIANLTIENNIDYMDNVRKRVKLRNTPSLIRHMSMISHISNSSTLDNLCMTSSVSLDNSIFNFTVSKDSIGYDTVKNIKRSPIIDGGTYHNQFGSLTSRSSSHSLRNYSRSIDESSYHRHSSHSSTVSSVAAMDCNAESASCQYMGVCLPLDPLMIFSILDEPIDIPDVYAPDENDQVDSESGFTYHSDLKCISCHKCSKNIKTDFYNSHRICQTVIPDDEVLTDNNSLAAIANRGVSPQNIAPDTPVRSLTGSCTSSSSVDLVSNAGHPPQNKLASLRREVLKIVMNLSSSVAIKSSEQSLLNMKQKYPTIFQDVCLYSEICHLLTYYRFRFTARKFLQEFFQDLSFDALIEDAERVIQRR